MSKFSAGFILAAVCASFGTGRTEAASPAARPNILWVVWDTVRTDRMGVYGYDRPTTPFVSRWAKNARVFENCISAAPTTAASHASMFTGLLPVTHRTDNTNRILPLELDTIAELMRNGGYRTYLYSANPFIIDKFRFTQGIDVSDHPWDIRRRGLATPIILRRMVEAGRPLPDFGDGKKGLTPWAATGTGVLAKDALLAWLADSDAERPFFAFLNYMEAHTPRRPPRRFREQVMPADQVAGSYASLGSEWAFTFRKSDPAPGVLEGYSNAYDAAVAELDALFRHLLAALEDRGALDNTIVVLTSDHGEHLGEHHMVNHQFSVYDPLLHVPLILHAPGRIEPGRDTHPVMNLDLFPTLLELAGLPVPDSPASVAVSLQRPLRERPRVAQYPTVPMWAIEGVRSNHPDWDLSSFLVPLESIQLDPHKVIRGSDGRRALYDLENDPGELNNLYAARPDVAATLSAELDIQLEQAAGVSPTREPPAPLTPTEHLRLKSLGYVGDGGNGE